MACVLKIEPKVRAVAIVTRNGKVVGKVPSGTVAAAFPKTIAQAIEKARKAEAEGEKDAASETPAAEDPF